MIPSTECSPEAIMVSRVSSVSGPARASCLVCHENIGKPTRKTLMACRIFLGSVNFAPIYFYARNTTDRDSPQELATLWETHFTDNRCAECWVPAVLRCTELRSDTRK